MHVTSQWQGKIDLVYQKQRDKTILKSHFCQAPFKIQRPFYPENNSLCHSIILHTAGGIVGGDVLLQDIHLLPESRVLITTPAATKIYRTAEKKAIQEINIKLENNCYLEYLPQEAIVFNQAQFEQKTKVHLAKNNSFLMWEINRFGRSARGEIFSAGNWRSDLEIWRGEKPLWIDRQRLQGEENMFNSINALSGKPVIGNIIYVGSIHGDAIAPIKELIMTKFADEEVGMTTIQEGLLCRYHGYSTTKAKDFFMAIWQILRQKQQLCANIKPRVWM